MLINGHAGFGERPEETDQEQSRHRASGRLYGVISPDRFPAQFPPRGRIPQVKVLFSGVRGLPRAGRGLSDVLGSGIVSAPGWRGDQLGRLACVTVEIWAGQAAYGTGGSWVAVKAVDQACRQRQRAGRCKVRQPRPCRASRAGALMRWRRSVAPRARAWKEPARQPSAHSRLWVIAAKVSQAAFAAKTPEGKCASGPSIRSALTCSCTA